MSGADSATSIVFDVDVGTGPNQVIALDVNQKLPAVNASKLEGITADQINDSTVSNSEFNMLAGVRTISGEDGPGGLIQDQLDNKAQKGNNTDILSITGLTTMLAINQGGTGASTAEDARTNLDLNCTPNKKKNRAVRGGGEEKRGRRKDKRSQKDRG